MTGTVRSPMRIAIVGAGPAGSALAILLARHGAEVTLFDDGRRPELLVGESLVPAIVPIMKRLGLEEDARSIGLQKPGVSFAWTADDRFSFTFERFAPAVFPYAYNIARPGFDDLLVARAMEAGARRVDARARLVRPADNRIELALDADTLAAAPHLAGRQPDLIVDATGRARQAAHALDIAARVGPRRDVAHFAHFEGFTWSDPPGQVLIARLAAGWSWRIPLQDRLSVGIVLGRDDAARLGPTPEERLEHAIAVDPFLAPALDGAKRVTSVATFANYQLTSTRAVGPGWVMVGDAFGFVDPMLSPGVYLALRSSELVADALAPLVRRGAAPSPAEIGAALRPYVLAYENLLGAWTDLIGYFYGGQMMALMRAGQDWMRQRSGIAARVAQRHIERRVALLASGTDTTGRYSRALLRFLTRHALRGVEPGPFAIR
jgi:flavin-dependent dehydrogenase